MKSLMKLFYLVAIPKSKHKQKNQSIWKKYLPKVADTRITPLFEIVECCYKPEFESSYVIMLIVACITGSFIAFKNIIHFTCMEYLRVILYTLRDLRSIEAFGYFGCFEISVTVFQVVHFM